MKYIEVPDFHFAPEWADVSEKVFSAVIDAVDKHSADFIAMPGDITDRGLLASDRGGLNLLRKIISSSPVTVVATEGTPSHEPPGSLKHLADCGVVILKPSAVYGYAKGGVFPIEFFNEYPDVILFGIPEISKKHIQSQLKLTAEQANGEAEQQLRRYIAEFIAPMRAKYPDIPAICLFHGNMTDARRENQTDIIIRASDIISHSEDWLIAELDRITCGHIHTPWESKIAKAGYAGFTGIDSNPYAKPGFIPAMNLVEIQSGTTTITRIPYGTPMRMVVTGLDLATDPNVAYMIKTDNPEAKLPDGLHEWSKISYDPDRKTTRRVTKEEAGSILSLRDLFKLIDPDVKENVLNLVDEITDFVKQAERTKTHVRIDEIEVAGCILFKGRTMKLSRDQMVTGLNNIHGGNGSGKSSTLSFWSPFPNIIGKDTDSGRASSIKDFFNKKDSYIKKTLTVNGVAHEHMITIKAAHTQSPKTECYLTIAGIPQLECGTFDEMFEACERLYGSLDDFLLTSFSVQPQQTRNERSLMSATMTDIRDLVQHIAGIDREQEKRYALDKAAWLDESIKKLSAWLSAAEQFMVDIPALEESLNEVTMAESEAQRRLKDLDERGRSARIILDQAKKILEATNAEIARRNANQNRIYVIKSEMETLENESESLKEAADALGSNLAKINFDDEAIKKNESRQKIISDNESEEREYRTKIAEEELRRKVLMSSFNTKLSEEKSDIKHLESSIESKKNAAESLNQPCYHCGKNHPAAEEKIKQILAPVAELEVRLANKITNVNSMTPPNFGPISARTPALKPAPDPEQTLDPFIRLELQREIEKGQKASARIEQINISIEKLRPEWHSLSVEKYTIDEDAQDRADKADNDYSELRQRYAQTDQQLKELRRRIDEINQAISKAKEQEDDIKAKKGQLTEDKKNLELWQYIAKMLRSDKIPALELDLKLDAIDSIATATITPLENGRYSFETSTQQEGKKSAVDRFDIKVFDSAEGTDKSFLKHSPGEKAFLADAYSKALMRQRPISYDPVVMDESDGPIQPERLSAYYQMQTAGREETTVLVVSHNPASHEYIQNHIAIEEVLS